MISRLLEKRELLRVQICEMITEREHDLSKGIDPQSTPQVKKDLENVKNKLTSAINSREMMIELLKNRQEEFEKVSNMNTSEKFEEMKTQYAEKIIEAGHLKGQNRGLTNELKSLRNEAARIREKIREVKGELSSCGGNPWQVGVAYGGSRPWRQWDRMEEGDRGDRSRRQDGDQEWRHRREGGCFPPSRDWGDRSRGQDGDQERRHRGEGGCFPPGRDWGDRSRGQDGDRGRRHRGGWGDRGGEMETRSGAKRGLEGTSFQVETGET